MFHIRRVEVVVSQVVEHYFVRREICGVSGLAQSLVETEKQGGFAELVAVEAVGQMAYWGLTVNITRPAPFFCESGCYGKSGSAHFFRFEKAALECRWRKFMAVPCRQSVVAAKVHVCRAECDNDKRLALHEVVEPGLRRIDVGKNMCGVAPAVARGIVEAVIATGPSTRSASV